MATELKFSRIDDAPWGFRLTGGRDFDIPLTVVKIAESSLAERIGLTEGDTVVQINEQCTSQMTHDEAHDVITKAGNHFIMAVIRAEHQLITNGHHDQETISDVYQDIPPVDQDICPITAEVPCPQITSIDFIDRSLTDSPYLNPNKHYRPFSTEPIEGIPSVEDPIILDPAYHDDFSHIIIPDDKPETIFKLERVNHKPEKENTKSGKVYLEETRNQIKEENSSVDGMIDLTAIEISAKEIVEDSIRKAEMVTEEIKKEIEIELNNLSTEEAVTTVQKKSESKEIVESPTEEHMWVMTAEYDSEEYERRRSSIKAAEIALATTQTESSISLLESQSNQTELQNVKTSLESVQITQSSKAVTDSQIETSLISNTTAESVVKTSEASEITSNVSVENHISESKTTEVDVSAIAVSQSSEVIEQTSKDFRSQNEIQEVKQKSEVVDVHQKHEEITSSQETRSQSNEVSEQHINERRTQLEESEYSLRQAKQQTLQAANTITEETRLRMMQRQIPSISSMSPQHYTDQILRTFFVHLTDVMLALSRMIVAESGGMTYGSRSASPMPPLKRDTKNVDLVEQVVTHTQAQKTQQSSTVSSSQNASTQNQFQNAATQVEMYGKIVGSTEEVEKLVESVEITRKLAESVQQARKLSITAQQSQMLAESAEQLRRLSITAEQTIQQDLAEHSEIALEKLSNELSQVSDMVTVGESEVANECNFKRESTVLEQIIGERDPLEWLSEKDEELHMINVSTEQTKSEEISEQRYETHEESTEVRQEHIEIRQASSIEIESTEIKQESVVSQVIASEEISAAVVVNETDTVESLIIEADSTKSKALPEPLDLTKVLQRTNSDNSESGLVVQPPTPLTDEYVFKLDIHVKGLKSRTATPEPAKPAVEAPPEHVPKKPKLIASIMTEIESSAVDTKPNEPTNDEASVARDDPNRENEKDLHMLAADANSLQLPHEFDTSQKTEGTQSAWNRTTAEENEVSIKQVEIKSIEETKVESLEQAGFRSVKLVVEAEKKKDVSNGVENDTDGLEGKPGLTDDEIAVIISGEAEMLKEAHVLGLKRVIASHMNRVKDDEEDDDPYSVNFKKIMPQCSFIKDSEVFKALNEEAVKTKAEEKKEEMKWTTFLQRPNRPVPRRPGQTYVPEAKEKYQVKIVKQPKPKVAPDYPRSFETGLLPWEERLLNQPAVPPVEKEPPILIPEDGPEYLEALDNLPESAVPDLEDTGIPLPPEEEDTDEQLESQEEAFANQGDIEDNQGGDTDSCLDQTTESNLDALDNMVSEMDPNLTPEEQLAQIQAQLIALSQLPAAIQQTLDMVTKQLGKFVPQAVAKKQQIVAQEDTTDDQHTDVDQGLTTDEERLDEVSQEQSTEEIESRLQEEPIVEEPPEPQIDQEEVERLRKEEEAKYIAQRIIDKQKKDLMAELQQEHQQRQVKQRPTPRVSSPRPAFGPLAPQQRPIFLPGGRKWRNEKDAFNDAFISETLTKQAELIQGKTLGFESDKLPYDPRVNFLKYEKPPISLDHLKESDVYKMVHDMDALPLKAIEKKSNIPIAEDEFREKCRSVTPTVALDRQEIYEDHTVLPQQVQP